ncbi:hypothetical protein GS532_07735 [Rhodococcus hoagii]|nr:hypothetical protein [Prescottella equi]
MSTAKQIIAEHLPMYGGDVPVCSCRKAEWEPAHVVAALTSAGKTIVDAKALDSAIWLSLGDESDDANEPNYEEDNYDAGFIAGLERAQVTIRTQLPALLAAARVAEGGDQP